MSGKEIELVKDDDPYTRVLNALIFDENLRLQTRMVLIMMTSVRPDWDFSVRGMAKIAHVTKDTMAKMLAELEEAGYVRRKAQPRNAKGRFSKAGYLVSRKPIFKNETDAGHKNYDTDDPCPTSPYTIEPDAKNSPQLNTKQLTTKQLISPCSPPPGEVVPAGSEPEGNPSPEDKPAPKGRRSRQKKSVPIHAPERFELFWQTYPGGGSRLKAVEEWDKLAASPELLTEMARALKRQKASRMWQEGIGIPHAFRWLRDRRWTDKLPEAPVPQDDSGGWAYDPE